MDAARLGVLLALLVVLAGCAAPSHGRPGDSAPNQRTDPASDRLGWEGGLWYDDPIDVNASDGLDEAELEVVVRRAMARIERLRGLEFEETVPVELVNRSTYREEYLGSGPTNQSRRTAENVKQEALFLVGEVEDAVEAEQENRASSVLGFYSSREDQIVIVSESASPTLEIRTLAHELVHALQDQQLGFLQNHGDGTDEAMRTRLAVVEGDARYVDRLYVDRCDGNWTCIEAPIADGNGTDAGSGDDAPDLHQGLYLTSIFPYVDGAAFVRQRKQAGGWDAVNDLYTDPPVSTEQVIDPSKYRTDAPTNVSLPDDSNDRWKRVRPSGGHPGYATVGQPGLVAMFAYPSYDSSRGRDSVVGASFLNVEFGVLNESDPLNYDIAYADGWDGDRLWVYRNESGATGYVWRLVWDSPGEAREFVDGYRQVLRYWGAREVRDGVWRIPEGESEFADAFAVERAGDTVTITNAPTLQQLGGVHAPLRR